MAKLSFINDEKLDLAISHVTKALDTLQQDKIEIIEAVEGNNIFSSSLFSNSIDPFAMKFGMALYGEEKWLEMEVIRQLYKTFEQKIGEFHQLILGSVDGWVDLQTGDESQVDLKREDDSMFIELKNKHNTCNSSSLAEVEKKLKLILHNNPESEAYYAFILPKVKQKFGTELWKTGGGVNAPIKHERLYRVWGADIYKLVTGDRNNLMKLYEILNTANLNIPATTQTLIGVSDDIIEAILPKFSLIKSKIYEEMLIGRDN